MGLSRENSASKADKSPETSDTLTWPCFEPDLSQHIYSLDQTGAPFNPKRQRSIESGHDIWEHVLPEDCVEVLIMARPSGLRYYDCEVGIRVFKMWEPSPEMLALF